MIPNIFEGLSTQPNEPMPSKTYRLDEKSGRIAGHVDGTDAIMQAAYKILKTERFVHEIYSRHYGAEIVGLIGRDKAYVNSVLPSRVSDALLADDRITSIEDFAILEIDSETMLMRCTVNTSQGVVALEWRQSYGG